MFFLSLDCIAKNFGGEIDVIHRAKFTAPCGASISSKRSGRDLLEEIAKTHPHHLAVISNDKHLTFKELNERFQFIAVHLFASGIQLGSPVAVYAERSIEIIIAFFEIEH